MINISLFECPSVPTTLPVVVRNKKVQDYLLWMRRAKSQLYTTGTKVFCRKRSENIKKRFFLIKNKFIQKRPNAFKCIRMGPNASQQVRMDPNGSEHIRKPRKTCENLEKTCESFEELREIFTKTFFTAQYSQRPMLHCQATVR